MTMTCPKCQAPMRQYERAGVTIDQCIECRGIFLDRGELERLVDAEETYQRPPSSGLPPAPGYPPPGAGHQPGYPPSGQSAHGYPSPGYGTSHNAYSSHGSSHGYYGGQHGHRRHKGHRRKKSLFDDLFG